VELHGKERGSDETPVGGGFVFVLGAAQLGPPDTLPLRAGRPNLSNRSPFL